MTLRPSRQMQPSARTFAALLALVATLLVLPLALAPRAETKAALSSPVDNPPREGMAVGRANLDGTGVDRNLVSALGVAGDVAVNDSHVYWTRSESYPPSFVFVNNAIGRANLDGSHADPNFISGLPGFSSGIAVDAEHVYWKSGDNIGRANLDGTGVDPSFISVTGVGYGGLAVDDGHIYWSHDYFIPDSAGIGRANLDGSAPDPQSIPVRAEGITVDAQHLYWTGTYSDGFAPGPSIGRANVDGSDIQELFMGGATGLHPMLFTDVAVDAAHIYWTQYGTYVAGTIGRANLDNTGSDSDFLTGLGIGTYPARLTVDDDHIYWTHRDYEVAGRASVPPTQTQNGNRIIVRVKVKAQEQLTAKATGKIEINPTYKLKPKKVQVAEGTKTLKLKPKKAQAERIARALDARKKATAKLKVKLTDQAGNSDTEKLRVRLRR